MFCPVSDFMIRRVVQNRRGSCHSGFTFRCLLPDFLFGEKKAPEAYNHPEYDSFHYIKYQPGLPDPADFFESAVCQIQQYDTIVKKGSGQNLGVKH